MSQAPPPSNTSLTLPSYSSTLILPTNESDPSSAVQTTLPASIMKYHRRNGAEHVISNSSKYTAIRIPPMDSEVYFSMMNILKTHKNQINNNRSKKDKNISTNDSSSNKRNDRASDPTFDKNDDLNTIDNRIKEWMNLRKSNEKELEEIQMKIKQTKNSLKKAEEQVAKATQQLETCKIQHTKKLKHLLKRKKNMRQTEEQQLHLDISTQEDLLKKRIEELNETLRQKEEEWKRQDEKEAELKEIERKRNEELEKERKAKENEKLEQMKISKKRSWAEASQNGNDDESEDEGEVDEDGEGIISRRKKRAISDDIKNDTENEQTLDSTKMALDLQKKKEEIDDLHRTKSQMAWLMKQVIMANLKRKKLQQMKTPK